ncbi:MAG: hypothetical protein ACE5WD_11685 [Candidatus Aminicenantia bacterium]
MKKIMLSGGEQIIVILKSSFGSWKKFEEFEKKRLGKNYSKRQRETAKDWLEGIKKVREKERKHHIRFIYNNETEEIRFKQY